MTVPGRVEAAALLLSLDPPVWFLRHSRAVAEVAGWLASRTAAAGTPLDRPLVEAAGLLHDVDKVLPAGDPAGALRHGDGSADWLARRGHPELGLAVACHPVTRLADDAWYARWIANSSGEERIVAYADKRAGQRLAPIAARFASWDRRYPAAWSTAERRAIRRRAAELERLVCEPAGIAPDAIRRLGWTRSALAEARGSA